MLAARKERNRFHKDKKFVEINAKRKAGFHHMSEATHSSALPDIPRRHQRQSIASSLLSDMQY